MAAKDLELIDEIRREARLLVVAQLLLVMRERTAGACERHAADAAIVVALVLIARCKRDNRVVASLMGNCRREQRLDIRLPDDVLDRSGGSQRVDNRLLIVGLMIGRNDE